MWTVIRRAAEGSAVDRDVFAERYAPVIRAYLRARWRGTVRIHDVEDATQEVFVQCFKEGGALTRAEPERAAGFRGYLYGVVRNVARRLERAPHRRREAQPDSRLDLREIEAEEAPLSRVFDRAWAGARLQEAGRRQLADAARKGPEAVRRHELLVLRYRDDLPIREIARRWEVDAAWLHGQFRQAREEFKRALIDTVCEETGGTRASAEAECERLLQLLL